MMSMRETFALEEEEMADEAEGRGVGAASVVSI